MGKRTVLVVDDTEENIDILVDILKQDYKVRVATNGMGALKAVTRELPDIILLDILMPEMDGYEVCRRLKTTPGTRKIPVIFISALEDEDAKVKTFELGAVDYVHKPFQMQEVVARVRTHLEIARSRKELEETMSETFAGTIRLMTDLLSMINPDLFSLSTKLRSEMKSQCKLYEIDATWDMELAGLLAPIGMTALAPEVLEKIVNEPEIQKHEIAHLESSTKLAIQLLSHIPRLEGVIDILKYSNLDPDELLTEDRDFRNLPREKKGGLILRMLRECPNLSASLIDDPFFIQNRLKKQYDIKDETHTPKIKVKYELFNFPISKFQEGYILQDDILSEKDGRKLITRGFVLTKESILLLHKQCETNHVDNTKEYQVFVPEIVEAPEQSTVAT